MIHGKRRHWYAPWRTYCRCGLGAYPCATLVYQRAVAEQEASAEDQRLRRRDEVLRRQKAANLRAVQERIAEQRRYIIEPQGLPDVDPLRPGRGGYYRSGGGRRD